MATVEVDVREQIIAFKRRLAPTRESLKQAFADVKGHVSRAAERILKDVAAGRPVVPVARLPRHTERQRSRDRPSVDPEQRLRGGPWRAFAGQPCKRLVCAARPVSRDKRLRGTGSREAEPRRVLRGAQGRQAANLNVYWSKPQVMARQDPRLAARRVRFSIACGSTKACSTPTCSAPMPTGCAGGSPGTRHSAFPHTWTQARSSDGSTPATSRCTRTSLAGDWRGYDPFDATHRLQTRETRRQRSAACSAPIRAGRR